MMPPFRLHDLELAGESLRGPAAAIELAQVRTRTNRLQIRR